MSKELDERSLQLLGRMNEAVERDVKTWEDLFAVVESNFKQWSSCRCDGHSMQVILFQRAFIKAVEMNPEQGDAVEMAKELNKYLLLTCNEMGIIYAEDTDDLSDAVARELLPLIDEDDLSPTKTIH